jgi:hypothetical protein
MYVCAHMRVPNPDRVDVRYSHMELVRHLGVNVCFDEVCRIAHKNIS